MTKFNRIKKRLDDEWGLKLTRNSSNNPGWLSGACKTGYIVSGNFPGRGGCWQRYNTLKEIVETLDKSYIPPIEFETGIPCFECKKRSGLDCAGRKPDESTRCRKCLDKNREKEKQREEDHLTSMLESGEITLVQYEDFVREMRKNYE